MSAMKGKLDAELHAAFEAAGGDRDKIEAFRNLAKQDPGATAAAVSQLIPLFMERYRTQANESYGVDIAREGWKEKSKQKRRSLAEDLHLLDVANRYLVFSWCQMKLGAYAADDSLSNEEWAAKVCEVGIEALRGTKAVSQHTLQELLGASSGEAARFVRSVLAPELAGELATRISVERHGRLRKALDDIREHNKPARRARFEALLRELYSLAPEEWANHHVTDWQLEATRSTVVKAIEQRQTPQAAEDELATFADWERRLKRDRKAREGLLKRGREAGLPPREYELLKLLVEKPKISSSEAGQRLGLSPGAVRTLKKRIKDTLGAA
jgi:DNA-binding CsgD family transcriptional regulator